MKFIPGAPAALVGDALVIAEMHLGIEFSMHQKGARIFPDAKKYAAEVNALLKSSGAQKVIFLGDLKQDVKGFEQRERKLLTEFLSLLKVEEKILVKGNHDAGLEQLEGLQVIGPEGVVFHDGDEGEVGLAHGHAWPAKQVLSCSTICLGHTHPVIEFVDQNGHRKVEKIWLSGQTKFFDEKARRQGDAHGIREGTKVVIFPAFSKWVGGIPVNARFPTYPLLASGQKESSIKQEGLLGPFFANGLFDLDNAFAYTLDGVQLGKISFLRQKGGLRLPRGKKGR